MCDDDHPLEQLEEKEDAHRKLHDESALRHLHLALYHLNKSHDPYTPLELPVFDGSQDLSNIKDTLNKLAEQQKFHNFKD